MTRVTAFAPATVANVASGFDVLGLALDEPGDRVVAERGERPGVTLSAVEGDGGRLPRESGENTASVAAAKLLEETATEASVHLRLEKGLPLSSGMGSSAASAVAAVLAVDRLLELGASREQLLRAALAGEQVAAGAQHADNAAACLYGGIVLVRSTRPLDVVTLPVPSGLSVALIRPHLEISTRDSRALLGDVVPLQQAVAQWANLGALVAGLHRGDLELVSRALVDHVAEPVRSEQIPGFVAVKQAAVDAGALGCSLSGAGPSIFALCRDADASERASQAMAAALASAAGLRADRHFGPISLRGARIVETVPCAS